ncbi:DUF3696 domain-containing protein [Paeniglutamicibacter sp. ZC-3]|uniref:DUF3696 domain-containing protein n=1 Tax=Paeniglutamicibacter sp. ZC-3 TaxID=2986919 RepID=UPI0021F70362|nr:DUF3696 domain-containing protein [Paeniglutamicibacter sp. ZC-3]MCV9993421.1 DUF3696 domain-containing protein [Paeniglutamicibacter sp. ZC-3]
MIDDRPDEEIASASDGLATKLLDITRGGMPVDQGISLAIHLIFLRWHLLKIEGGSEIWSEIVVQPGRAKESIERVLTRTLHHPPWNVAGNGVAPKAVSSMCAAITDSLTGSTERCLDLLRQSFEAVLGLYRKKESRALGEYMGPDSIVRLSVAIVGRQSAYIDPASGYGTTLRTAHLVNPHAEITGFDVSTHSLTIAEMRLRMVGKTPNLSAGDAFDLANGLESRFGGVIVQPPWHAMVDSESMAGRAELLGADLPAPSLRTDFAWVELALYLLAPGGRAAVFLTQSSARPVKWQHKSHKRLLELGAIEAIIDFPQGGMAASTSVPTTLWILRKPDEDARRSDVLLVDASTIVHRDRFSTTLSDNDVDQLAEIVELWRTKRNVDSPGYIARALSIAEFDLQRKGMVPGLYLDEAPQDEISLPEPPERLITRLDIKGYKAFSEPVNIPLAPLTLVYGANSAGKSSVIQSLLLLKQSVEYDHLITQGILADVGNFEGVSSGHRNEDMEFGFQYGALPSWIADAGTADPASLREIGFTFSSHPTETSPTGALRQVSMSWGDHRIALRSTSDGRLHLPLNAAQQVMTGIASGKVLFPFDAWAGEGDDPVKSARNLKYRQNRAAAAARQFEKIGERELTIAANGLLPSAEVEYSRIFRGSYSEREFSTATTYTNRLARLMDGISSEVRALLAGISYLGPLRSAPKRFYDRASTGDRPGDGYETAMLLFNNGVIVDEVNKWLRNLDVPYELKMIPVEPQGGLSSIVGDLVVMALTDTRSGVQVTPADVGYGVSQMLPIVVTLLAETDSVVCVEQPETHLHPRLQARLADLFISSSSDEGQSNQLVVETHSEHLMLRVQRRIREGALSPEDVAILYVNQDGSGQGEVVRIRLSEEGEFLDEWPDGFFEERLSEIFGEDI